MLPQTRFNMIVFHSLVLFFPVAMLVLWRRPQFWLPLLLIFLGAVTGLISLRTDDPQFPVLLLLVFSSFAGFVHPDRAWLFALLLAVWVPLMDVASMMSGATWGRTTIIPGSLIAFIPAVIGANIGAFVHRASGQLHRNVV